MKIIKYFKLFESRSSELSQTEFEKIKDNCKDFINNLNCYKEINKDSILNTHI
jgi:hypothetical protein